MTREQAKAKAHEINGLWVKGLPEDRVLVERVIANALMEAAATEREECAKIADYHVHNGSLAIAHEIRARGKQ